jgi:hypothetical protein
VPFSLGSLNDFRANFGAGVGAVAARVGNQDWVYKFDISGSTARMIRSYKVGLGDTVSFSGLQVPPRPRFDFKSIGILADGRVVTSFFDSTTFSHPSGSGSVFGVVTPALAIENFTALPEYKPDLKPVSASFSAQKVSGGDQVTFSASIENAGLGAAAASAVRFLVDGVQVGADRTLGALGAGARATVTSEAWNAKHQATGNHTVEVVVDPAGAVAETDEANNRLTGTVYVEGNKIRNGSFEQSSNGSSPDGWSSSGSTAYESGGSDGSHSVSTGPGGSWTSEPVAIEPGKAYEASVVSAGAAATLLVQQLGADGAVLASTATTLVPTPTFAVGALRLTALAGAAQVRVVLLGGLAGKTTFDEARLVVG